MADFKPPLSLLISLALLSFLPTLSSLSPPRLFRPPRYAPHHRQKSFNHSGPLGAPKYHYETRFFEQNLDHFSFSDLPKFRQRYLINTKHWAGPERAGPIFFYCGNEGDIEWFAVNTGFLWEIAPRFRAMIVFPEEELYAKICSLSYMGDLRMLFAEDRNKVTKIVQGQFKLFQKMYNPFLEEFAAHDLLRISSSADQKVNIIQDCGSSTTCSLVSSLPLPLRCHMGMKLGEKKAIDESGRAIQQVAVESKEQAADCMRKIMRCKVMDHDSWCPVQDRLLQAY